MHCIVGKEEYFVGEWNRICAAEGLNAAYVLNKTMPFDIGNSIEKEGFTDAMINTLLKERIFFKKAESFSLPGGVYIKAGSDKILLTINPLTMIYELYISIRVKYETYKSFRKSFVPIINMIYRSACNLFKVLFLYFFDYQNSRTPLKNKGQAKDNLSKIDNWLRGIGKRRGLS